MIENTAQAEAAAQENREEREVPRKIKKNAAWLFTGQLFGRALRTAVLIYAARALGVSGWGAASYALSIATFFTVFSDFGINALITREVSRKPEEKDAYISTAFFIKLAAVSALAIISVYLSGKITNIAEAARLMPIVAFIVAFDTLRDLGAAVARALDRMKIEGINNIATNAVIAGAGFFVLFRNPGSESFMWSYVLGTGAGLMFIAISLRAYIGRVLSGFRLSLVKKIISAAWPFGLVALMGIIMINTDIIIIGWIRSVEEVGLYSAGQKIIQLLYIIPTIIATAFFPTLSRAAAHETKFRPLFEQALSVIFMIAAPLALGGMILSRQIIELVYGAEYLAAAPSFFVLSATILIVFPAVLIANAIFAHDQQKKLLLYVLLGLIGNVALDLVLIPIWGITGSAIATFINELFINAYSWSKMKKINHFRILPRLGKIVMASAAMSATCFLLARLGIPLLVNILIAGLLYFGILYAAKDASLFKFLGIQKKIIGGGDGF